MRPRACLPVSAALRGALRAGADRPRRAGTHREERNDYEQKASYCKRRKERLNVDGLEEHKRAQDKCHAKRSARFQRTEQALGEARRARDALEHELEGQEAELKKMDEAGNDVGAHFAKRKHEHERVLDALGRIVEIIGIPEAVEAASKSVQAKPLEGSPKEALVSLLQTAEPSTGPRMTMQGEIETELARLHAEEEEVERKSDEEAQQKLAQAMANAGVATGDEAAAASSSPAPESGADTGAGDVTGGDAPQEAAGEATADAPDATGGEVPQEAGQEDGLFAHPPAQPAVTARRVNRKQAMGGALAPDAGMATGPVHVVESVESQATEQAAAAMEEMEEEAKEAEKEPAAAPTGATGGSSGSGSGPKPAPLHRSDVEHLASLLAALRSSLHASLGDYRQGLKAAHEEWQAAYDAKRSHVLDLERQLRERETRVHHSRQEHNQSRRARDVCFKGRKQLLAALSAARDAWEATHEECQGHHQHFQTNLARHQQNMRLLTRLEKLINSKLSSMGTYLEKVLEEEPAATGATGVSEPAPKAKKPRTSASGHISGGDEGPAPAPEPNVEKKEEEEEERPAATAATGPSPAPHKRKPAPKPAPKPKHKPEAKPEYKAPRPDVSEAKRRGKSAAAAILRDLDEELKEAAAEAPEEEEEFEPRTFRSLTAASGATGVEILNAGAVAAGDAELAGPEVEGGHFDEAAGFGDLDLDQDDAGATTKCDREPDSPECRGASV